MRHIAIDYGTKNVGIAFSDEEGTMGFPFGVLPNTEKLTDALLELITEKGVEHIVIGESTNLHGGDNPVASPARALGVELSGRTGLPVAYESELFTTQQARRNFDGSYNSSSGIVDAQAAALILTGYLERKGN